MVWMMPLDLVAEVRCFFGRDLRQLEGEAQTRSTPRRVKTALLDRHLLRRAGVEPAADLGVLALDVLAHDHEVDVAGLAAGERAGHPLEEPHRAEVDVLVEAAADGDQKAPERDMVGHGGPAHGAEEDRVVAGDRLEPVLRHEAAGPGVAVAAPVLLVEGEVEAEAGGRLLQHGDALGHHLPADPVARDHRDSRALHAFPPIAAARGRSPTIGRPLPCWKGGLGGRAGLVLRRSIG
jgi:hypothetical protein